MTYDLWILSPDHEEGSRGHNIIKQGQLQEIRSANDEGGSSADSDAQEDLGGSKDQEGLFDLHLHI